METLERQVVVGLTEQISSLLRGELPQPLRCEEIESRELQDLVEHFDKLLVSFAQASTFISALASGDLKSEVPSRNLLVSPFKQLHSVLRHLIWQTEQMAKGHLDQQVDFLGDFSRAFSAMLASMREKKRLTETLRENEKLLSNIFKSIKDGIVVVDTQFNMLRVNPSVEKWSGEESTIRGGKCFEVLRNRDAPCEECPGPKTIETGKRGHGMVEKMVMGKGHIWIERHAFPLLEGESGEITGVIVYIRNVTDQKNAEEQLKASLQEKEALMREIHHRVKNNFQVVCDLIELQAGHPPRGGYAELLRDVEARIKVMARVHEQLYLSQSFSQIKINEYLDGLISGLMAAYPRKDARIAIKTEAEEICLDEDTAIRCGLVITELVSNAIKHANPKGGDAKIRVTLRSTCEGESQLVVSDNGVGLPEGMESGGGRSLGLKLVIALTKKMRGRMHVDRSNGTEFKIVFPPAQ